MACRLVEGRRLLAAALAGTLLLGGCATARTVVEGVDADAAHTLPSALFAATAGGDVLVRQKDGKLIPEKAVYRVRLRALETPENLVGHSWRGRIAIQGAWSPPAWRWLRTAATVLVRESGF